MTAPRTSDEFLALVQKSGVVDSKRLSWSRRTALLSRPLPFGYFSVGSGEPSYLSFFHAGGNTHRKNCRGRSDVRIHISGSCLTPT